MPGNAPAPTVLYTSKKCRSESDIIIKFLTESGHRFTVKEEAEDELACRFGEVRLPGVLLADCFWVPSSEPDFEKHVQNFVMDVMLHAQDKSTPSPENTKTTSSCSLHNEIVVSPPPPPSSPGPSMQPSLRRICLPLHGVSSSTTSTSSVRSLNSWMKWTRSGLRRRNSTGSAVQKKGPESSMEVMLRLSRVMDACLTMCQRSSVVHPLFLELEEAVCELQVTPMPDNPLEKVTFAINLHNLIVRHAMILSASNQEDPSWMWPKSLAELNLFFGRTGYDVGGERISIQDLRLSLFGTRQLPLLDSQPVQPKGGVGFFSSCRSTSAALTDATKEVFYSAPSVNTDVKIPLILAYGTQFSPVVSTVYPDLLEATMQSAAESYCQNHVQVGAEKGHTVILPTILSWHRADFGTTRENVVRGIKDLLSDEQRRRIRASYESGDLKIRFDDGTNWARALVVTGVPGGSRSTASSLLAGAPQPSSPRKISSSSCSPTVKKDIETGGFPYQARLQKPQKKPVARLSRMKSRREPGYGDARLVSPARGRSTTTVPKGGQPHLAFIMESPTTSNSILSDTELVAPLVRHQEEEDESNNNSSTSTNLRSFLHHDVSAMTFGSEFDIRVSERRFAPLD